MSKRRARFGSGFVLSRRATLAVVCAAGFGVACGTEPLAPRAQMPAGFLAPRALSVDSLAIGPGERLVLFSETDSVVRVLRGHKMYDANDRQIGVIDAETAEGLRKVARQSRAVRNLVDKLKAKRPDLMRRSVASPSALTLLQGPPTVRSTLAASMTVFRSGPSRAPGKGLLALPQSGLTSVSGNPSWLPERVGDHRVRDDGIISVLTTLASVDTDDPCIAAGLHLMNVTDTYFSAVSAYQALVDFAAGERQTFVSVCGFANPLDESLAATCLGLEANAIIATGLAVAADSWRAFCYDICVDAGYWMNYYGCVPPE